MKLKRLRRAERAPKKYVAHPTFAILNIFDAHFIFVIVGRFELTNMTGLTELGLWTRTVTAIQILLTLASLQLKIKLFKSCIY